MFPIFASISPAQPVKTRYLVRRRFVEAKVQNTTDLLVPIEMVLYDI